MLKQNEKRNEMKEIDKKLKELNYKNTIFLLLSFDRTGGAWPRGNKFKQNHETFHRKSNLLSFLMKIIYLN
jgi:hypothetical protein